MDDSRSGQGGHPYGGHKSKGPAGQKTNGAVMVLVTGAESNCRHTDFQSKQQRFWAMELVAECSRWWQIVSFRGLEMENPEVRRGADAGAQGRRAGSRAME